MVHPKNEKQNNALNTGGKHTYIRTDRQTDKQKDKQTERKKDKQKEKPLLYDLDLLILFFVMTYHNRI